MAASLEVFRRATITVEEAARVLGISRGSAYEAVRRGQLPTIRIGKRLIVPVASLERMLASAGADAEESAQVASGGGA